MVPRARLRKPAVILFLIPPLILDRIFNLHLTQLDLWRLDMRETWTICCEFVETITRMQLAAMPPARIDLDSIQLTTRANLLFCKQKTKLKFERSELDCNSDNDNRYDDFIEMLYT